MITLGTLCSGIGLIDLGLERAGLGPTKWQVEILSLWVDRVRRALARSGYETLPIPLAASDCGAPHRRGRVFIVAHLNEYGESAFSEHAEMASTSNATHLDGAGFKRHRSPTYEGRAGSAANSWGAPIPDFLRVVHGSAPRLDGARARISALGDSCTPQQAEVIGHIVRLLAGDM